MFNDLKKRANSFLDESVELNIVDEIDKIKKYFGYINPLLRSSFLSDDFKSNAIRAAIDFNLYEKRGDILRYYEILLDYYSKNFSETNMRNLNILIRNSMRNGVSRDYISSIFSNNKIVISKIALMTPLNYDESKLYLKVDKFMHMPLHFDIDQMVNKIDSFFSKENVSSVYEQLLKFNNPKALAIISCMDYHVNKSDSFKVKYYEYFLRYYCYIYSNRVKDGRDTEGVLNLIRGAAEKALYSGVDENYVAHLYSKYGVPVIDELSDDIVQDVEEVVVTDAAKNKGVVGDERGSSVSKGKHFTKINVNENSINDEINSLNELLSKVEFGSQNWYDISLSIISLKMKLIKDKNSLEFQKLQMDYYSMYAVYLNRFNDGTKSQEFINAMCDKVSDLNKKFSELGINYVDFDLNNIVDKVTDYSFVDVINSIIRKKKFNSFSDEIVDFESLRRISLDDEKSYKSKLTDLLISADFLKSKDNELYLMYMVEYYTTMVDYLKKYDGESPKILFYANRYIDTKNELQALNKAYFIANERETIVSQQRVSDKATVPRLRGAAAKPKVVSEDANMIQAINDVVSGKTTEEEKMMDAINGVVSEQMPENDIMMDAINEVVSEKGLSKKDLKSFKENVLKKNSYSIIKLITSKKKKRVSSDAYLSRRQKMAKGMKKFADYLQGKVNDFSEFVAGLSDDDGIQFAGSNGYSSDVQQSFGRRR